MIYAEDALIKLLDEQSSKKAAFNKLIQFDYLGMDNTPDGMERRYQTMKTLATRIVFIETMLEVWAEHLPLPC